MQWPASRRPFLFGRAPMVCSAAIPPRILPKINGAAGAFRTRRSSAIQRRSRNLASEAGRYRCVRIIRRVAKRRTFKVHGFKRLSGGVPMRKSLTAIAAAATIAVAAIAAPQPAQARHGHRSPAASSAAWPPAPSSGRPSPTAPTTTAPAPIITGPARIMGPAYYGPGCYVV